MADIASSKVWLARTVFLMLALCVVFVQLLPLDLRPTRWAAPDILLAMTLAWVTRRPDYAPVYVITGIFLLTDVLFQRPPGLWAALVVILTEVLRARAKGIRNMPIALEWGSVALGIAAITLANRCVLAIAMTPQAPMVLSFIQMAMTIAIYPAIVVIAHYIFGVSRTAPGQVDSLGHRL